MKRYSKHLLDMTVVVESPIRSRRMRITPRAAEAWAKLQDGGKFRHRQIAALTGYSLGGVNVLIHTLRTVGAMRVYTARGRNGVTVLRPVRGARIVSGVRSTLDRLRDAMRAALNVHHRTHVVSSSSLSVVRSEHSLPTSPPYAEPPATPIDVVLRRMFPGVLDATSET